MKRIFLYFLLFLFIAGLATLAYGFWNAKNIRLWAAAAGEIKAHHSIAAKEKNITNQFQTSGGQKMEDLKNELAGFSTDLESIYKETESAKQETENLNTPGPARPVQKELVDFYTQSGQQSQNLANVATFMNQLFAVAVIFDSITADTTLDEIKGMIGEAKTKSSDIDPENLPPEMKDSGTDLKAAAYNYLDALDQYATGKVDNHDELDTTYADFSQKQSNFWEARKNLAIYSNTQNLDNIENKIDSDLMILSRVRFSIK